MDAFSQRLDFAQRSLIFCMSLFFIMPQNRHDYSWRRSLRNYAPNDNKTQKHFDSISLTLPFSISANLSCAELND